VTPMRHQRKKITILVLGFMILLGAFRVSSAVAEEKKPVYDVITVSAAITPPIATHILKSIEESEKSGADGLIIRLDTPGAGGRNVNHHRQR
jgi:membrane-bound ClpP family serine protease